MTRLRCCLVCLQPRSMRRDEAVCLTCKRCIDKELHPELFAMEREALEQEVGR